MLYIRLCGVCWSAWCMMTTAAWVRVLNANFSSVLMLIVGGTNNQNIVSEHRSRPEHYRRTITFPPDVFRRTSGVGPCCNAAPPVSAQEIGAGDNGGFTKEVVLVHAKRDKCTTHLPPALQPIAHAHGRYFFDRAW
ncbi:unnamed protein product [Ectocarpus sp. 12 AP-2014]